MDLKLDVESVRDRTVVRVGGEVDIETSPQLGGLLADLADGGASHIVVDLDTIEFLDSTGLGVLVGGYKRASADDGSLSLVCTQERILKLLRITGLTKVFTVHDTVEDAVTAGS